MQQDLNALSAASKKSAGQKGPLEAGVVLKSAVLHQLCCISVSENPACYCTSTNYRSAIPVAVQRGLPFAVLVADASQPER
jgi:hypothetical protein